MAGFGWPEYVGTSTGALVGSTTVVMYIRLAITLSS